MLLPSVFGEDLFDETFPFAGMTDRHGHDKLFGNRAGRLMKLGGGVHVIAQTAQLVDTHFKAGAGAGGIFGEHQRHAQGRLSDDQR